METYAIPEENIDKLRSRIEKLNKRAERLSLDPIELTAVGNHLVEVKTERDKRLTLTGRMVKYFDVTVSGTSPMIKGWALVAIIDHDPESTKNMIRTIPGVGINIPSKFRTTNPTCDHCNKIRRRNSTYLLVKDEGPKVWTVVGKSCLKDYTGHKSPEAIARWFSYVADLIDELRDEDSPLISMSGTGRYIDTKHFIAICIAIIGEYGWVSRSRAREEHMRSTADIALDYGGAKARGVEMPEITADYIEKAELAIEWIRNEAPKTDDFENNDYLNNLAILCDYDTNNAFNIRYAGYVASIPMAHRRAIEEYHEREKERPSEWVGEIKKREDFDLTVMNEVEFETEYGYSTVFNFEDNVGNKFTWFSSNAPEIEIGGNYRIKGTVKDHDTYRDRKVTIITRCKVMEVINEPVLEAA